MSNNLSFVRYLSDGVTTSFSLSFGGEDIGYFRTTDIKVYVNGSLVNASIQPQTPHIVTLETAPAVGAEVLLRREVPYNTTYADFSRGNNFGQRQLNNSFLQQLYLTQELLDGFLPEGHYFKQSLDFGGYTVRNVGEPIAGTDVVNKTYLEDTILRWGELNPTAGGTIASAVLTSSGVSVQYYIDKHDTGGHSVHTRVFNNYQDMISNTDGYISMSGEVVSSGTTMWKVTTNPNGKPVANTAPQLYVKPLNGVWVVDMGVIFGDDSADNFLAMNYVASECMDNWSLIWSSGVCNIKWEGGYDPLSIRGKVACPLFNLTNVVNKSMGTVITCYHDVSVNGGLMAFSHDAMKGVEWHNFKFSMDFYGRNNSSEYYPFCGAIFGEDTQGLAGSRTSSQLSIDVKVEDCTFDLFHPEGSYGKAANGYPQDPNNGFKIYSYFFSGDSAATEPEHQNTNCFFNRNTFSDRHNAYGVWVWAVGNFVADFNIANKWCNGVTDAGGAWLGYSAIPMIRYIKWYTSGCHVGSGNRCISRPLSERVGSYQGASIYCHVVDNMAVDVEVGGVCKVSGYHKMSTGDVGVVVGAYGDVYIDGFMVEGYSSDDRPTAVIDIFSGEGGSSYIHLRDCIVGKEVSAPFVRGDVGASTAAKRRVKSLDIKGCTAENCLDSIVTFLNTSNKPSFGIETVTIEGNRFNGKNSQFEAGNSNKVAINAALFNVATDTITIRNNDIQSFYFRERSGLAVPRIAGNIGGDIVTSQNYNYLEIFDQQRGSVYVPSGIVPRVGVSNTDLFSFHASRADSSGLILQTTAGIVAGGSSVGGATPAGQTWVIDQTLIGKKN